MVRIFNSLIKIRYQGRGVHCDWPCKICIAQAGVEIYIQIIYFFIFLGGKFIFWFSIRIIFFSLICVSPPCGGNHLRKGVFYFFYSNQVIFIYNNKYNLINKNYYNIIIFIYLYYIIYYYY
uniref:Uncharacterized protein n=1 Tax=Paramoeba aparasomata TaxID=2583407 RepID=A0A5P8HBI0_9EUKA|nr:hypothetical protein [Paramoeba aparasomata]